MNEMYQKATDLLRKVSTPLGFTAAPNDRDNYKRVWTRDAIVCGIACLTTGDEKLISTFKASLITCWQHQHKTGFLPSNVNPFTATVSYGGSAGRADNPSWAIIGACLYARHTGDHSFLTQISNQIDRAFLLMDAWEYNGRGLIYIPQSGNWADEYLQHGYMLFEQLLRLYALQLAGQLLHRTDYTDKAAQVKALIENNFFYRADKENWYAPSLVRQKENAPTGFWWMGFNPAQLYSQFDLQANAWALLLKTGDADCQKKLLNWLEAQQSAPGLIPSYYPAVENKDVLMHELKDNYAYGFRNRPHEFHNGGIWPVWNGWMAAAVYPHNRALYTLMCQKMTETVLHKKGHFNECMHGQTGDPCGVDQCAWSAAGAILAAQAPALNNLIQL
jgi:hypothetical protein